MKVPSRSAGFTLVELMVVMAILAIVISIGVPSFNTLIKNNRLSAASNDIAGALQFARAEAVRRGRTVQVQALANDIANGLQVWFDENSDGNYDAGEEIRVVALADVSGLAVTADITNLDMAYSPRGAVNGAGNALNITLCDDRTGNHGKQLRLLASGVLRLTSQISCS
ncbi:GspH/FimT family pseudopilin [Microbulbifer sp. SA54]|uniref:GspH/FimT family pseudopilin n=1 Tax=Microbulbifer sp. SA54 TaxID=3401577 RepID=UPI003AB08A8D